MTPRPVLYGSSASFDGISNIVAEFYCGRKTLKPAAADSWTVHQANGTLIFGVRVVLKYGRYRFESAPVLR